MMPLIMTCRILYLAVVRLIIGISKHNLAAFYKSLTNRLESCKRFECRVVLQSWKGLHEHLLLKSDFLYCPNVLTLPRSVIFTKLSIIKYSPNPYQLQPQQTLGTLTPVLWVNPFDVWPCLRDLSAAMPRHLESRPGEIVQCGSLSPFKVSVHSRCSCVCLILVCFAAFSFSYCSSGSFCVFVFVFVFVSVPSSFCLVNLGIPVIYYLSILSFAWLLPEVIDEKWLSFNVNVILIKNKNTYLIKYREDRVYQLHVTSVNDTW